MLNALRRGPAAAACLLATVGLVATGLVVLPVSRGVASTSASAGPTRLTVSPAVGGPTSIVSVHFVADPTDTVYGGDELAVIGPANTRCAGDLIGDGYMDGPNADGSGPVTLYIGPRVEVEYPQLADSNVYDPISARRQPLSHDGARACTQGKFGSTARRELWSTPSSSGSPPPNARNCRRPSRATSGR
jgi:hypothetical protein